MVGFDGESKELDADKLRQYIFGGHVANYMRYLSEEDDERYKKHFAAYIKEGLTADDVRGREGVERVFCRIHFIMIYVTLPVMNVWAF